MCALRLGLVVPVHPVVHQIVGQRRRHLGLPAAVAGPRLEQQHAHGRVGAQPVGQHAAGRAGADDDVVELGPVSSSPARQLPGEIVAGQRPGGRRSRRSAGPSAKLSQSPSIIAARPVATVLARGAPTSGRRSWRRWLVEAAGIDALQPGQARVVRRLAPEGEPGDDHLRLELALGEARVDHRLDPLARARGRAQRRHDAAAQLDQQRAHGGGQQRALAAEIMVDDARARRRRRG